MTSMLRTRRTRWSILRIWIVAMRWILAIPYHDPDEDLVPEPFRRRAGARLLRRRAKACRRHRAAGHGSAPAQHAGGRLWQPHAGRVRDLPVHSVAARADHSRQRPPRAGRGLRRLRIELGPGPGDPGSTR